MVELKTVDVTSLEVALHITVIWVETELSHCQRSSLCGCWVEFLFWTVSEKERAV